MTPQEVKVLFKAVEDTSVKKVIDNIKGEVRSLEDASKGAGGKITDLSTKGWTGYSGPGGTIKRGWTAASQLKGLLGESRKVGTESAANFSEKFRERMHRDRATFMKDMTFLMMPLMNPMSIWANLFSTRQTFSALQTKTGQGMLGRIGMGGLGGSAAATIGLVGIATALGLAFKGLTKTVKEAYNAIEHARQLYAKALMSGGLSLGFTVRRGMAANVMGVSERDVLQFANAFNFLNPKLEWASSLLAKTTPNLTSVNWEIKILGQNLEALFSDIASDAAPSLRKFASGLSEVIKQIDDWYEKHRKYSGDIFRMGLQAIGGFGALGLLTAYDKMGGIGKDTGAAPEPMAYMKRFKASAWERMGLVVGGLGGVNPQQQTAHNTKKTAENTQKIVEHLSRLPRGDTTFGNIQNHL